MLRSAVLSYGAKGHRMTLNVTLILPLMTAGNFVCAIDFPTSIPEEQHDAHPLL